MRIPGVEDAALGEHDHARFDRVEGVSADAGGLACGVVRDDPTDGRGLGAGGVRPQAAAVRSQLGVYLRDCRPCPGADAASTVEDFDLAEAPANVHEHSVGDSLATEARSRSPEREMPLA